MLLLSYVMERLSVRVGLGALPNSKKKYSNHFVTRKNSERVSLSSVRAAI
jgi:hypothetical protein